MNSDAALDDFHSRMSMLKPTDALNASSPLMTSTRSGSFSFTTNRRFCALSHDTPSKPLLRTLSMCRCRLGWPATDTRVVSGRICTQYRPWLCSSAMT